MRDIIPKVSVLMPVYNAAPFLREAIESILCQTFTDFEFLIINDGSTDESLSIIDSYSDKRITCLSFSQNQGLIYVLNKGLDMAMGEYIARMDADDVARPERLSRQVDFLDNNPHIAVCGVNKFHLGPGKKVRAGRGLSDLEVRTLNVLNCPVAHPGVVMRNSFLKEHRLRYNPDYPHAEDTALWTDILLLSKIEVLEDSLIGYRFHENQVSNRHVSIQRDNSTRRRVELFEKVSGEKLVKDEMRLYRALSYLETGLATQDFKLLAKFANKLVRVYSNQQVYEIDGDRLKVLLYHRLTMLYLRHSYLGFLVFVSYLRNHFFDTDISIGIRLLGRILFKARK